MPLKNGGRRWKSHTPGRILFPGGRRGGLGSGPVAVVPLGYSLVFHHIAVGEALVHHAVVELQIEIVQIDQTVAQVVQPDLPEGADEQMEHAQWSRASGIAEHLAGKLLQGVLRAAGVPVDDAADAVARGLETGHGVLAVTVEDHAKETVHELAVLPLAVGVTTHRLEGTGVEIGSAHERIFLETVDHLTPYIGVKTFIINRYKRHGLSGSFDLIP